MRLREGEEGEKITKLNAVERKIGASEHMAE